MFFILGYKWPSTLIVFPLILVLVLAGSRHGLHFFEVHTKCEAFLSVTKGLHTGRPILVGTLLFFIVITGSGMGRNVSKYIFWPITDEAGGLSPCVMTRDNILSNLEVIGTRTNPRIFTHFSRDGHFFSLTCSAEKLEHLSRYSFFPLIVENIVKSWPSLFCNLSF